MSIFQFVKESVSILSVIQEYTSLKQAGIYWKGCCPFHSEKTASFTVSPHRDIFYCFGCHAGGDVIAFIAKLENCSQLEATKMLIDRHNLKPPQEYMQEIASTQQLLDQKQRYYKVYATVAAWCQQNLANHKEALAYVAKRNLSPATLQHFGVGYFPNNRSLKSLMGYCQKDNILMQDLMEAGIVAEGQRGLYSPFEERIIFPIKTALGEHCGFGGRVFLEHDDRPKYYNSKESPYFAKSTILFGLDLAKKEMQKTDQVFLVEGYTDCLAMVQHGFTNTIATLGTACTSEHLKLLTRFVQQIYVLYDGDNAGQQAILRLTELAWNANLELKVVSLPEKEDPASFLEHGGNLIKLVQDAKDIYSFFVTASSTSYNGRRLSDKLQSVKKVTTIIGRLQDPLKRSILLQETAQAFNIPLDMLHRELVLGPKDLSDSTLLQTESVPESQLFLLGAIINNTELLSPTVEQLIPYLFASVADVLNQIVTIKATGNQQASVLSLLTPEHRQLIMQALMYYEQSTSNSFDTIVEQMQKKHWKRIIQTLKEQLTHAQQERDEVKMKMIVEQFQQIKQKITEGQ